MSKDTPITNIIQNYLDFLVAKGRSKSTIEAYRNDLNQFTQYIKKELKTSSPAINTITNSIIQLYVEHLNQIRYKNKTIRRKLNVLKSLFKYLVAHKILQSDPTQNVMLPESIDTQPRVLSEIEYRALRDVCRTNIRLYTMVELLLQTGMRIGELARLSLDDIFIKNATKQIRDRTSSTNEDSYLVVQKYGSKPARKIYLNKAAQTAISLWLKYRPKSIYSNLYVTSTGKPIPVRNIRLMITRALKKANIQDATVNDIRNTFIAHQIARGVSIMAIQKIAGHKSISTTQKYIGLIPTKVRNVKPVQL